MKTIVRIDTDASIVLVSDQTAVTPTFDCVFVGSGRNLFVLGDRNVQTVDVFENVTAPDDWAPYKYLFDGTAWTPNPDYVAPKTE